MGAQATLITFHSGNGAVPSNDALFSFEIGPVSTDFAALVAADFAAAQAGPKAFIIAPHPAWLPALAEDATAKWIGTNAAAAIGGNTALYALTFNLPSAVLSATLNLHFAVDNQLGSANNVGIFLNGSAASPAFISSSFTSETAFNSTTVGSLLHAGSNTIFFDAVNTPAPGGPAGFIVTGTLTTVDATTVPEPSTLLLLGGALVALGCVRYRRRPQQ